MKIIVDVERQEKILQLKAEIGKLGEQVLTTNAAMKATGSTSAQVAAALEPQNARLRELTDEFKRLEQAAKVAGHGGAQGLMQLGYAIDDIQYGFSAIVNNIPQIVQGFGLGAGIAGAVGIAAVAINQLMKHWGELTDLFQAAWTGTPLAEIEKVRLKAEETTEAFDKLIKKKSEFEAKSETAREKIITEGPDEAIFKGLVESLGHSGLGAQATPEETSRIAEEKARVAAGEDRAWAVRKAEKEMHDRITKANEGRAEQLMVDATKGKEAEAKPAIATIGELQKQFPGAFPKEKGDIGQALENASPEGVKRQERFEKQIDAQEKVRQKIKQADEEHKQKMIASAQVEAQTEKERLKQEEELIKERDHALAKEGHDRARFAEEVGQIQKAANLRDLEDRRDALMKRKAEIQWQAKLESAYVTGGSAMSFIQSTQKSALGDPAKESLQKLHDIDKILEKIHDEQKKVQRIPAASFG